MDQIQLVSQSSMEWSQQDPIQLVSQFQPGPARGGPAPTWPTGEKEHGPTSSNLGGGVWPGFIQLPEGGGMTQPQPAVWGSGVGNRAMEKGGYIYCH